MTAVVTRKQAGVNSELARLELLAPAELRLTWQIQEGSSAPSLATLLLHRLLAQRLQERRLGGLSALVVRELERVASGGTVAPSPVPRPSLTTGTRLIREWNGQTITVEVTDDGFLWNDRTWRSLSHIAREATGAHWSGPRFFGLKRSG